MNLTRVASLRPLLDFLQKVGAPTERLLGSAGIPSGLTDEPDAFLTLRSMHQLIDNCVQSLDLPDLGAVVAAETSAFDVAYLGPELRRAVTVHDYLQIGAQLIPQVTTGERFWMTLEKDQVRFHHESPGRPGNGRVQEDMYCMVTTLRMLRVALGPDWCPIEMDLLTTDPRTLGEPEIFGDAVLRLGQSHSSFTMPFTALQQRMPGRPEPERAEGSAPLPIEPALPRSFIDDLDAIVSARLSAGAPGLTEVADSTGMSARTLQRRLRESGYSYSDVVHRARIRLASDWLVHTTLPIQEISASLGYTDPANFTRAFRRTTGISPQRFRNSQ